MSLKSLDRQGFLKGTRQAWVVVFLAWGALVLAVSIYFPHVEVGAFLSYPMAIGTTLLIGLSADSAIKTNAAAKIKQDNYAGEK